MKSVQTRRGLYTIRQGAQVRLAGGAEMKAASVKRCDSLLTDDGGKRCVHSLQNRDSRLRDTCSISIGANPVRQSSYDLAALFV